MPKISLSGTELTKHVTIGRPGIGPDGERFLRVRIFVPGVEKPVGIWFRIDDLRGPLDPRINRLNRLGANLITLAARNEFLKRLQAATPSGKPRRVAIRIGPFGDAFVLPRKTCGPEKVGRDLSDIPDALLSWDRSSGDMKGVRELLRLFKGNSRCVLALGLQFVGPLRLVMRIEQPAFQLVGVGGTGKSSIGKAASSVWGWRETGDAGAGEGWNATPGQFERILAARNYTALYLEEGTHQTAPAIFVSNVFLIQGGEGRGRYTEVRRWDWFVPVLSTSNTPMAEVLRQARFPVDRAGLDRMIDVPCPKIVFGMYENLHGFEDVGVLSSRMLHLAERNHGILGRRYLRALMASDRAELEEFIKSHIEYFRRSAGPLLKSRPELARATGRFGVVYAALMVATNLGVISIGRLEARDALMTCLHDHAEFTAGAAPAVAPELRRSALQLLRDHVATKAMMALPASPPSGHVHATCPGYRFEEGGRSWIAIPWSVLGAAVGGKAATTTLLRRLDSAGHVRTTGGGASGRRFVTKITLGSRRPYAIVIAEDALTPV